MAIVYDLYLLSGLDRRPPPRLRLLRRLLRVTVRRGSFRKSQNIHQRVTK